MRRRCWPSRWPRGNAASVAGRIGQGNRRRASPGCSPRATSPARRTRRRWCTRPGPAARVLLVGLGKADEIDRATIRRAAAIAAKRARSLGVPRAAFHLPAEARGKVAPAEAAQAIAEGLGAGRLAVQRDEEAGGGNKKPPLERSDVLAHDGPRPTLITGAQGGRGDRGRADLCSRTPGAAGQRRHAELCGQRRPGAGSAPWVRNHHPRQGRHH